MSNAQKWLIVFAIQVFAIGVLLHASTGRYRLPILADDYVRGAEHAVTYYGARYDTWTGRLEITYLIPFTNKGNGDLKIRWKETPSCWIKDLK